MAGTAVTKTTEFQEGSEVEELRASLNKVVDDLEAIRAALVAHGAVAHAAVALPAGDLTAYKVQKLQ